MAISSGREAMQQLTGVLNLPKETNRVVIDLSLDAIATVYVVELMTSEQVDALEQVLGGLTELRVIPSPCGP